MTDTQNLICEPKQVGSRNWAFTYQWNCQVYDSLMEYVSWSCFLRLESRKRVRTVEFLLHIDMLAFVVTCCHVQCIIRVLNANSLLHYYQHWPVVTVGRTIYRTISLHSINHPGFDEKTELHTINCLKIALLAWSVGVVWWSLIIWRERFVGMWRESE